MLQQAAGQLRGLDRLQGEPISGEVLSQPIGVVWLRLADPRRGEQDPTGVRKVARRLADANDVLELDSIEAVEGSSLVAKQADEDGRRVAFADAMTAGAGLPEGAQTVDLLLHALEADAASFT